MADTGGMRGTVDTTPARVLDGTSTPEPFERAVAAGHDADLATRGESFEEMAHAITLPFEEEVAVGDAHCQRCEVLPRKLRGPGTLLVSFPHTHTLGKAMRWVRESGVPYDEADGVVSLRMAAGSLDPVIGPLSALLTPTERRMTRVVYRADGTLSATGGPFDAEDIATFAARAGADWLLDLLRGKRFAVHFQPIIDEAGVHGYECLLRGVAADGLIPPGRIFGVAAQADLVFQTDLAARRAALLAAAEHGIGERVFVNFTPNSIFDAAYCLDSTVRLVDELRLPREQIVFEIVESEKLPETDHLRAIVGYYRDHGFGVALDDVGAGYASLRAFLETRPDYAKIDRSLVRNVHADERKAILTSRLLDSARELGARTVFEGVEVAEEWAWGQAHGAELGQGYLFGRPQPRPVRV